MSPPIEQSSMNQAPLWNSDCSAFTSFGWVRKLGQRFTLWSAGRKSIIFKRAYREALNFGITMAKTEALGCE
ncbi:MAG: hypothetical protein M2R45_01864 [Verrucomicrobia subdivision 3 bacterium]|nr:hypothetical protein [Limisphaerales bacterium]